MCRLFLLFFSSFYCCCIIFIIAKSFLLWLGRCFSCYLRVASYFYSRLLCCAVFDRHGSRLESETARCRCSMRFLPCGACCYHYKVRSFCCLAALSLLLLRFRNVFCFFLVVFFFIVLVELFCCFLSQSQTCFVILLFLSAVLFQCCFFSSYFCFLVLFAVFLLFVCPDLFVVIVSVTLNI